MINDVEHLSSAYWPLYVFFGKIPIQILCPILNQMLLLLLLLSCMSSLYILDINPFTDISFASIFSHSVAFFFHFAGGFLHCAKVF